MDVGFAEGQDADGHARTRSQAATRLLQSRTPSYCRIFKVYINKTAELVLSKPKSNCCYRLVCFLNLRFVKFTNSIDFIELITAMRQWVILQTDFRPLSVSAAKNRQENYLYYLNISKKNIGLFLQLLFC